MDEKTYRHFDICSGIGGFALGFFQTGRIQTVGFCEIDPFPRQILEARFPDVPIFNDVKGLVDEHANGSIPEFEILTAGYPCQPFSQAGKQRAEEDPRHLWPWIAEFIAQTRPSFCLFENVYGHIALGLDNVLFDLESQGYAATTLIIPACGVGAFHKRDRIWICARKIE
ncbi:MAG: DNA cytosine methyltransferase [Proteobacteria bacterium]|nr:DNA cytosine methyltransferase [Pseudomonadota bacterium]